MYVQDKFIQLLDKEFGYYEAILDITEQENGKFQRERPLSEIQPLMKKKQIFIACIDEISRELRPLKQEWKEDKSRYPLPLKELIEEHLKNFDALLKTILDLDKANNRMLEKRMAALKAQSRTTVKN